MATRRVLRVQQQLLAAACALSVLLAVAHAVVSPAPREEGVVALGTALESLGLADANATEAAGRGRSLLASALIADIALPLLSPVVNLALKPVEIIVLEWIVNPITYQVKRSYREDLKEESAAEETDDLALPIVGAPTEGGDYAAASEDPVQAEEDFDFWANLGSSIQSIFVINGPAEEGSTAQSIASGLPLAALEDTLEDMIAKSSRGLIVVDDRTKVATTTSNLDLKPAGSIEEGEPNPSAGRRDTRKMNVESTLLDRFIPLRERNAPPLDRSVNHPLREPTRTLDRRITRAVAPPPRAKQAAPAKFSLLKCGKIKSKIDGASERIVSGTEANLVMKLEGFTPSTPVILFGSQELAGDHLLPPPIISKELIQSTLDESVNFSGESFVEAPCGDLALGLGGLVDTIGMGLNTPHKILRIVNRTNREGTTFVQRMKFTSRYCTGQLYFQALDTATCKLTHVVNATLPEGF